MGQQAQHTNSTVHVVLPAAVSDAPEHLKAPIGVHFGYAECHFRFKAVFLDKQTDRSDAHLAPLPLKAIQAPQQRHSAFLTLLQEIVLGYGGSLLKGSCYGPVDLRQTLQHACTLRSP